MREIKFRIWDNGFIYLNRAEGYFLLDKAGPNYINEFTDLKDTNGKEIYEGDVIQIEYGQTIVGKVIYGDGYYTVDDFNKGFYLCKAEIESLGMEVIGNIYENPELLNEKN